MAAVPVVSGRVLRVGLFLVGAMGAGLVGVQDALSGDPKLTWTALAMAACTAIVGYATKFARDYSEEDLQNLWPFRPTKPEVVPVPAEAPTPGPIDVAQ